MFSVSKGVGAQEKIMEIIGIRRVMATVDATLPVSERTVEPDDEQVEYEVVPGSRLAELPAEAAQAARIIFRSVDRASFGAIGAVGVALLFWTVIKVMGKIEKTFNSIWGVREGRSLLRKFADYISVLIMVPIIMLLATSVNAMLSSEQFTNMLQVRLGPLFWFYDRALGLTTLLMLFLAFMFLYMFMPNTRVRVFPALIGAIVGGTLWYLTQWGYFSLQVGLAKKNAIYGTLAAVPVFLLWVYLNWLIVLIGAEIAFAVQSFHTYPFEYMAESASFSTRHVLSMLIVHEVCQEFMEKGEKWNPEDFSRKYGIPVRLVSSVLHELVEGNILVRTGTRDARYLPARDIERLTLNDVERAVRGETSTAVNIAAQTESPFLNRAIKEHYALLTDALEKTSFRRMLLEEESNTRA